MVVKRNRKSGILFGLLFALIALFAYTPLLANNPWIVIPIVMSILLIVANANTRCFQDNIQLAVCVIVYIFICVFYRIIGISDSSLGTYAKHFLFFIPILLMLVSQKHISEKQSRWIFYLVLAIISINIIDNIRICIIHPEIAVYVNRDRMSDDLVGDSLNIGASKWYNGVFFFLTVCYFTYLNTKIKRIKIVTLVCSIITCVFIFAFCLKASVIVFAIFVLLSLPIVKRVEKMRKRIWVVVIISFILLLLIMFLSDLIIDYLIQIIPSKRLAYRLIFLLDSDNVDAGAGSSTVNARASLWLLSINTWLSSFFSFLFGIGDHRVTETTSAVLTGIGQHSEFLDSMARYGILGFFFLYKILKNSFLFIISLFERQYHLQLYVIFFVFIMFGITKGVFQPNLAVCFFILLPLSGRLLNK